MSQWSSFKQEQVRFNNWRNFLNENVSDLDTDADIYRAAGITSSAMEDSLVNFLKNVKELTRVQKQQLINLFFKYAKEEEVLLEQLGGSGAPNRTFSGEATAAVQDLLNSFGLEKDALRKVTRILNQWANTNQVKLTPPTTSPAPPPEAKTPEEKEPAEEPTIVKKVATAVSDTAEKARDLANTEAAQALEGALDAVSFVPGANVPASLASAGLNVAQGDYDEALLSFAALIPAGKVAAKAGKYGPVVLKVAKSLKAADKARAARNVRATIENALKKSGSEATVNDVVGATKKLVDLAEMADDIPGLEWVGTLTQEYINPLRSAIEDVDGKESAPDKKKKKEKVEVTPETQAVVIVDPEEPEVYLSKPGNQQEVERIASEPVVDKEELSQSAFEYTPSKQADEEEQRKINKKIEQTLEPKNVSITSDDSAVTAIRKALGDEKVAEDKIKDLIGAYLDASESDRQDRNKTKDMITRFLGGVDIDPVRSVLQSLDIKPQEENPVSELAAMLANIKAGLAGIDAEPDDDDTEDEKRSPLDEPALQGTKTVKEYITESHEDKFKKLLKAFTK